MLFPQRERVHGIKQEIAAAFPMRSVAERTRMKDATTRAEVERGESQKKAPPKGEAKVLGMALRSRNDGHLRERTAKTE